MRERRYVVVDVFTSTPLRGNPVAVLLDAEDIDAAAMQRLAAWTNLSETVCVLPPTTPEASYRVRIFTPREELPFAGHPALGTAHAVIEAGLVPRSPTLRQECGAGVLGLRLEDERFWVRTPPAQVLSDDPETLRVVEEMLGAPLLRAAGARIVDLGPTWLVVQVDEVAALRAARPDLLGIEGLSRDLGLTGVTAFAVDPQADPRVVVRSFAPASGVPEDPVCGSGNASVAAFLAAAKRLDRLGPSWTASQGREVGRDGTVAVRVSDDGATIEVGGAAVTVVAGVLRL
ncbi:MAG: PhzF family phenazine biosynthesis protein [bacterium]|nr:PhzF family phenazine biosynthesis protein [bacterium]